MSKMVTNIAKGVISGIVVGTTVGIVANAIKTTKPKNKLMKSANKTFETLSSVMHSMAEMTK